MLCDAPSGRRSGFWTARPLAQRTRDLPVQDVPAQDRLSERRRELAALLEEIRDPAAHPVAREAAPGLRGRPEGRIPAFHEAG
jgi:hypothetical protein